MKMATSIRVAARISAHSAVEVPKSDREHRRTDDVDDLFPRRGSIPRALYAGRLSPPDRTTRRSRRARQRPQMSKCSMDEATFYRWLVIAG